MRLGPLEIRRAIAAAASPEPAPRARKELGASGTVNLNGFLSQSEYNNDLRGASGLRAFQRMSWSDGSVQEALEHIFAPVKNASWVVEPPDDPDENEAVATALAQACLFEWLDQPWGEHLDSVLEYLTFGHAVFETPLAVVERELRVEMPGEYDVDATTGKRSPKVNVLPARQWLTVDRFAPRLQETIWRWHQQGGRLQSIEQQVFKDDRWVNVTIPAEPGPDGGGLMVLTHKRRGDEFTGRSLIRAAHKPWVFKELIEKVAAIAVERHGVGTPVAYPPESADDAILDRLEDILRDLRSGAYSYIVSPGPKQTGQLANSANAYLFEILSPSGTIPDFTPLLEYQRAEIKASVLARFAELGHASVGARATGDIQSIVWFAALHGVARYICDSHQKILERVIDANVKVSRYPKLCAYDLESRNLAEYAAGIAQLVSSTAVNPDESFRSWVRKSIDAPEEDAPDEQDPNAPELDDQGNPIEPDPNAPPKPPAPTDGGGGGY